MREIKFRAWVKKEINGMGKEREINRMFYPEDGNKNHKEAFRPTMLKFGSQLEIDTDRENMIFLQFTGLKDKNGKEIYEGDIIEIEKTGGKVKGVAGMGTVYSDYWAGNLEVIGNIYENPELIK